MNLKQLYSVLLILHIVADTPQFVEEIQQVIYKAQGQPKIKRLYLRPTVSQGKNNNVSESKINYYWVSNIITRVENKSSNMGEFRTIRAFCRYMQLFSKIM